MTQVFEPQTVDAALKHPQIWRYFIAGDCPKFIEKIEHLRLVEKLFHAIFVVTPSELMKGSKYFG